MSLPPIPERVAAGVAWLDEHVGPEWPERVKVDLFDIESPCNCVLGFVYRDNAKPWFMSGFSFAREELLDDEQLAAFGFDIADDERASAYLPLQAEWRKVIAERQASR